MSTAPTIDPMASGSRPERLLLAAQTVGSVGDGCFIVTSALFAVRVVGLSPAHVGLGLTIGWALGFLAGAPVGRFADRRGLRGAAVVLALTTAVALLGLVAARGMAGFAPAIAAYAVSQSSSSSVRQALLIRLVEPARRTVVRARIQVRQNAGIGVGAALGGVALALDRPAVFVSVLLLDAAAFLGAAAVLTRLPAAPTSTGTATAETVASPAAEPVPPRRGVLADHRFLAATALNAVLTLYMPMLSVVLPLWIGARTDAPTWTVAALFVGNTAAVVALQVRAARRVHDLGSARRAVRWAGVLLCASCAVFAASSTVAGPVAASLVLAAGGALQVLGEVRLSAGSWAIAFELGDPDRPGEYQGVFGAGVPVARAVGPLALTVLVVGGGPIGWCVLGLVFAGAAVGLDVVVCDPSMRRDTAPSRR